MPEQPVQASEAPSTALPPLTFRQVRLGSGGPVTDVRITGGRITEIGDIRPDGSAEIPPRKGATLLPGLVDGHMHCMQWAERRQRIDVRSARSPTDVIKAIDAAIRDGQVPAKPGEIMTAHGFRDALWGGEPHKDLLGSAFPDQQIAVISQDLHAIWLSPALLARLGREHETGILREQAAIDVIYTLTQARSRDTLDRWVLEAVRSTTRRGITSIIDFECADNVSEWRRRAESAVLPARVRASVWRPWLEQTLDLGLRTGHPVDDHGLVEVGPFKLVADGSLNTRTAFCHAPYPTDDHDHGLLLLDEETLVHLMTTASSNGLQPAVHAIGDQANSIALSAFERVGCAGRIEHAQLIRPGDAPRFARPGLVTSIQPQHAMSDRDVADRYWEGRTGSSFPYRSLLRAGATLELGSDAPVAEPDPWHAIADAVFRTEDDRAPWHPEQSLPLEAALRAAAGGRDAPRLHDPADLVLVADDPAHLSNRDLRDIPVLATVVAGRCVHIGDE